jgi:hypothetical protein
MKRALIAAAARDGSGVSPSRNDDETVFLTCPIGGKEPGHDRRRMLRNVDFRLKISLRLGEGRSTTARPPIAETTCLLQCGAAAYAGEMQREQV